MTSTLTHDSGAQIAPRPLTPIAQSFGGAIRAEWIKLASLRSIRWTVAVAIVVGVGMSAMAAFGYYSMLNFEGSMMTPSPEFYASYFSGIVGMPSMFLALIFGVVGVFAISSEYSSGMILSTLTAVPKRGQVFAAKLIVVSLVSAAIALAISAVSVVIGILILPDSAEALSQTRVLTGLAGNVLFLVLITLFSYGIAGVFRSTAGGIAVLAGAMFVLPIGLQFLSMTGWEWVTELSNRIPLMLGQTLVSGVYELPAEAAALGSQIAFGEAALWMLVWTLVAVVPAAILFRSRDAK